MLITIILAVLLNTGVSIDTGSKKLQPKVEDSGVSSETVVKTYRKQLQDQVTASFIKVSEGAAFNLKFFWAQRQVSETTDAVIVRITIGDKEGCMMFVRRGTEWAAIPDDFIP